MTANARIRPRRDTATNWTTANPVLADGEMGVDTTNLKFKIGDGTTAWTGLSYVTGATGATGAAGADGLSLLNGAVDPTTEGVNGDFYINTAAHTLFGPKSGGAWGSGTSIVGPTGSAATVAVGSTTTGAAGSSAAVSNAGSSSAAIFNFTIPTGPQGPAGDVAKAADRTALAAIAGPTAGMVRALVEAGREGLFVFSSANLSTSVTADTLQGVYVAPSSDTTGASGAWVRKFTGAADPQWFGADGTGVADCKAAIQAAATVVGHVRVPQGKTFNSKGGIILPDSCKLEGPGTINFDASSTSWLIALGADGTALDVSNIWITGVHFTSSSDIGFMHIIRLSNSGTIDDFRFNNNVIDYPVSPGSTQDRWVIATSGKSGTRTNFQINGNHVNGAMQLIATAIGGNLIQHWQINGNQLKNTHSNAIAVVSLGGVSAGNLNTAEDIEICDNDIYATAFTNVGIFIGVDGVSTDHSLALRRFKIVGNRINITAVGAGQPDILIRLGNNCANLGSFDSVADTITIEDNDLYGGIQVVQESPSTASGTSLATNFLLKGNRFYGGNIDLSYLADGAVLMGNRSYGSRVALNVGCGRVASQNNRWRNFQPANADAQFTWDASCDVYSGVATGTDRVIFFNANAGKVQVGKFKNCVIDSYSTGSTYCAISTNGAGAPTVTVYDLTTSTTWAGGRYEIVTGSITETNTGVGAIGYITGNGAGGTVTQLTSKSTGVTLNKLCGNITLNNAALAANTAVGFTLTNSQIAANDVLILNHISGGTTSGYLLCAACAAGSAAIAVRNVTAGSLSDAMVLKFVVVKAAPN